MRSATSTICRQQQRNSLQHSWQSTTGFVFSPQGMHFVPFKKSTSHAKGVFLTFALPFRAWRSPFSSSSSSDLSSPLASASPSSPSPPLSLSPSPPSDKQRQDKRQGKARQGEVSNERVAPLRLRPQESRNTAQRHQRSLPGGLALCDAPSFADRHRPGMSFRNSAYKPYPRLHGACWKIGTARPWCYVRRNKLYTNNHVVVKRCSPILRLWHVHRHHHPRLCLHL